MTWLRDDDDMLDHEKWRRALRDGGDGALLVWARLRAWCSRRLTDGVIPADMVDEVAEIGRSRARARALRALVEHGLCARRACGSLAIVGYLERNPSRARVLEERDRRSEAQRKRRLGGNVTGHAPTSEPPVNPERDEVPSRPVPSRPLSLTHEEQPPEVPGLQIVWGGTVTMPGPDPTPSYLASCVMAGVKPEQARDTWVYYASKGLPPGDYPNLEGWLVLMAKQRQTGTTKAPKSGPRIVESDLDTTGAATAFRPSSDHERFCSDHGLDLSHAVRLYRASPEHAKVGFVESERRFMTRLKCWLATGTFIPDGPLPRPPAKLKEARA